MDVIDNYKYDDIINLPHHISKKHPRMSSHDRAAQFSPFAALTGHSESIAETARITDKKIELCDEEKSIISEKLRYISQMKDEMPVVRLEYFVPDERKDGGAYHIWECKVKKIDDFNKCVVLDDGKYILIENIVNLDGDIFNSLQFI